MTDPLSIRRLYGRAQGHPLRDNAQRLVDDLLPKLAVPLAGPLSAEELFGSDRPLGFETGFGKGEHLAFQAARHPDWGFLGAEPYLNGVAGLLSEIDLLSLSNVRIHRGDALDVLERLPDSSLDAFYLLHPDPWPKARHAKRRFVNPGPVDLVAAKLKPGAQFRIATDHVGYLRHVLTIMQSRTDFLWTAEAPSDWQDVPEDWPDTRFAAKARALGHDVWRLIYRRV
ncbi:MAG: tRNA (guanine(46)-N(7))-methyltransferase TrmB [Sandaracinobacteroides sp.]